MILAAGCGRRMLPLSAVCHKGLLPIGDTTPLDRLIEELSEAGVAAITVVTGYRAAEVEAHLRRGHPGAPLRFVRNPQHARTNNILSLALGLEELSADDELLLVECDLLLAPGILARLCAGPSRNVALIDRFRIGMDGTVVSIDNDRVTAIHPPELQSEDFEYRDTYKTLNVYRFTAPTVAGVLAPLVTGCSEHNAFYEAVLARVPDLPAVALIAEEVPAGSWMEIDDPVDFAAARFAFAPQERSGILDRTHGGRWALDLLDFSYMVNARFPTSAMLAAMRHALADLIGSYGSAQSVVDEKLSWLLRCDPELLVTLAGASQAYPIVRRHWAGARVALPEPTFGEYGRMFPQATGYPDHPEIGIDLAALDVVAGDHDLVVVVNPNNPTGNTLPVERLHALAARHPETTLLVDESFAGFTGATSLRALLKAEPLRNVVLLTSLGKVLGVSGMRLGYLYSADRALLRDLAADLPIWSLGSQTEHLLELTLKARPALEASLRATIADREALRSQLAGLPGIAAVHPSAGNFVLVDLDGPAETASTLRETLLAHEAIAIKDVSRRFPDGKPRVRLGVRLPEENARLIAALARRLPVPLIAAVPR